MSTLDILHHLSTYSFQPCRVTMCPPLSITFLHLKNSHIQWQQESFPTQATYCFPSSSKLSITSPLPFSNLTLNIFHERLLLCWVTMCPLLSITFLHIQWWQESFSHTTNVPIFVLAIYQFSSVFYNLNIKHSECQTIIFANYFGFKASLSFSLFYLLCFAKLSIFADFFSRISIESFVSSCCLCQSWGKVL